MKNLTSSVYNFEKLRTEGYLYIDKTEYLWNLVRPAKAMYFLSRPRRFGKSLTLSTLKAIFQGKKELFKGLAIYDKPYDWKEYPVIHLDMNGRDFDTIDALKDSLSNIVAEQGRAFNVQLEMEKPATMFQKLIEKLSADSPVVLLLDEYDKPILSNITEPNAKEYLKILKAFYSVIKEKSDRIRFAFVTGVTKFCHVSLFSDLNNLTNISMNANYATMLGYTQNEFESNFKDWIAETEAKQKLPHSEYLAQIKDWYDGYRFEETADSVYNPVSLANFFTNNGKFNNYWFETGTPTFLMGLIQKRNFNFNNILSETVPVSTFSSFEIDDIDPVTLLYQTGYLTIKDTELKYGQVKYWLDFPNREVSESFSAKILNAYSKKSQREVVNFCTHLSDAMVEENLPKFQKAMEVFFAGIAYDVHHKDEANFQNIFYAIFKLLGYNIYAESKTSDGRIDAIVETDKHIYLFEFKLNKDESALAQIKKKEYFKPYLLSSKKITLVGANFDTETGKLSDWKNEEVQ